MFFLQEFELLTAKLDKAAACLSLLQAIFLSKSHWAQRPSIALYCVESRRARPSAGAQAGSVSGEHKGKCHHSRNEAPANQSLSSFLPAPRCVSIGAQLVADTVGGVTLGRARPQLGPRPLGWPPLTPAFDDRLGPFVQPRRVQVKTREDDNGRKHKAHGGWESTLWGQRSSWTAE